MGIFGNNKLMVFSIVSTSITKKHQFIITKYSRFALPPLYSFFYSILGNFAWRLVFRYLHFPPMCQESPLRNFLAEKLFMTLVLTFFFIIQKFIYKKYF